MNTSRLALSLLLLLVPATAPAADLLLIDDFEAGGTASGLVFKRAYDLRDYPVLSWRWKVTGIVPGGMKNSNPATIQYGTDLPFAFEKKNTSTHLLRLKFF